jgi:hypothetical protein
VMLDTVKAVLKTIFFPFIVWAAIACVILAVAALGAIGGKEVDWVSTIRDAGRLQCLRTAALWGAIWFFRSSRRYHPIARFVGGFFITLKAAGLAGDVNTAWMWCAAMIVGFIFSLV